MQQEGGRVANILVEKGGAQIKPILLMARKEKGGVSKSLPNGYGEC